VNSSSFSAHIQNMVLAVGNACRASGWNCHLPILATEVGTALSFNQYGPYSATFPGALGTAVEAIQAMSFNATTVVTNDVFSTVSDTTNSWFDLAGTPRPTYDVYSQLLNHLGNYAFPVQVSGSGNLSVLATVSPNSSERHDLLVVNTDLKAGASFSTEFINRSNPALTARTLPAAFAPGAPVEVWEWSGVNVTINETVLHQVIPYHTSNPSTPAPVPWRYYPNGLPPDFTVPPQSLVLFETYNGPAVPVNFTEYGLPLGGTLRPLHWFLDVNGTHTSTDQASITLLMPPGTYPATGTPVLVPGPGTKLTPVERYAPSVAPVLRVGTTPLNLTVDFTLEWSVALSWNHSAGSVVLRDSASGEPAATVNWQPAGSSLALGVVPSPGFAFTGWSGEGAGEHGLPGRNGSFNGGYALSISLDPTGPIDEQAHFSPGLPVDFVETGLPNGTPWNVSLRGLNASSTHATVTFYEVDGTWGYDVANVTVRNPAMRNLTTYRFDRSQSNVTVLGTAVDVPVAFSEMFAVTLQESGLPAGTKWTASLAGGTSVATAGSTTASALVLSEANGTWGLKVPRIYPVDSPGYRPELLLPNGSRVNGSLAGVPVQGGPVTVQVQFVELTPNATRYPITFSESNVTAGTNWSVSVANGSDVASAGWSTGRTLQLWEPDGVWGFVASAAGYHFVRTQADVSVAGSSVSVAISFERLYPIVFTEHGLTLPFDPPTGWNVTVAPGNLFETNGSATGATLLLAEPNGTWGFLASAGPQYHFNRSLADIAVDGRGAAVNVVFDRLIGSTFEETGLPAGTAWPLEVHGFNGSNWNNGTSPSKLFFEVNGLWGFTVGEATTTDPTGGSVTYRVVRTLANGTQEAGPSGSFLVDGAAVVVGISFVPLTPPGPYEPVTFTEVGLPADATWTVEVRGATEAAGGNQSIVFPEHDGSYAFGAGAAGGYNVSSPLSFYLDAPLAVTVDFVPGNYLLWAETGLGPGLNWTVVLNGTRTLPASGGWTQDREFNGSDYRYTIPVVQKVRGGPSYVPTPRTGTFNLTGDGLTTVVRFIEAKSPVTFSARGLPVGGSYLVRLSNANRTTALLTLGFQEPNGTYTYDIVPPAGYFATPSHGTVNVTGAPIVIPVEFAVVGRGPTPPVWKLVLPASTTAVTLGLAAAGAFVLVGTLDRLRRRGAG
jgi:hypothetical protein